MPNRRYEPVRPLARPDAVAALDADDVGVVCDALIRITYHDPDRRWVQAHCLRLAQHADSQVRGLAVQCLGHLARIHRELDLEEALLVVQRLLRDPEVSGRAQDALDDIDMFLPGRRRI